MEAGENLPTISTLGQDPGFHPSAEVLLTHDLVVLMLHCSHKQDFVRRSALIMFAFKKIIVKNSLLMPLEQISLNCLICFFDNQLLHQPQVNVL